MIKTKRQTQVFLFRKKNNYANVIMYYYFRSSVFCVDTSRFPLHQGIVRAGGAYSEIRLGWGGGSRFLVGPSEYAHDHRIYKGAISFSFNMSKTLCFSYINILDR